MSDWYSLQCGIRQGGFLSLLKYTVFINSLITELKVSGLCCKLYRTPSTPVGYADDLATCSTSKYIIYGILIYGEDRPESYRNALLRTFRLGSDKISEHLHYDHVGDRASIFDDDVSGLEERISKARRTLKAISGLGVRRSGLTIRTCNIIFWSVIVPIATYGCELLFLTEGHVSILEEFQEYAGRKLQRFNARSSRACAFYTLGWVRLKRFVEVKKLIFMYSILMLNDDIPIKIVFLERARFFFEYKELCCDNQFRSPTFDLLCTAQKFRIFRKNREYGYNR